MLDDEYKLRARRVHGAPHAQREASVLDLLNQLSLLEGRCAGLARSTHALLVLLVSRRSVVRYLALLPPRLRSRVRNRANGEWVCVICVLLEVTGSLGVWYCLPLDGAGVVAISDNECAATRQASEAAEREQDRLEHAAARVPRQWRGGDDHCKPIAPAARVRLEHAQRDPLAPDPPVRKVFIQLAASM